MSAHHLSLHWAGWIQHPIIFKISFNIIPIPLLALATFFYFYIYQSTLYACRSSSVPATYFAHLSLLVMIVEQWPRGVKRVHVCLAVVSVVCCQVAVCSVVCCQVAVCSVVCCQVEVCSVVCCQVEVCSVVCCQVEVCLLWVLCVVR